MLKFKQINREEQVLQAQLSHIYGTLCNCLCAIERTESKLKPESECCRQTKKVERHNLSVEESKLQDLIKEIPGQLLCLQLSLSAIRNNSSPIVVNALREIYDFFVKWRQNRMCQDKIFLEFIHCVEKVLSGMNYQFPNYSSLLPDKVEQVEFNAENDLLNVFQLIAEKTCDAEEITQEFMNSDMKANINRYADEIDHSKRTPIVQQNIHNMLLNNNNNNNNNFSFKQKDKKKKSTKEKNQLQNNSNPLSDLPQDEAFLSPSKQNIDGKSADQKNEDENMYDDLT